MMRPLRAEASTIKLWLAQVANHLEPACMTAQDSLPHDEIADLGSQKLSEANLMDVMPTTTKEEEVRALNSISEIVAIEDLTNKLDAMPSRPSKAKEYEELSMEHTLLQVVASSRLSITKDCVLPIIKEAVVAATALAMTTTSCEDMMTEQMTQQVDTYFEDVVVVEDASEDEEIVSGMGITIENPIFLITIVDDPTHSTAEVKVEEAQLTEDPPL
ncbi:hypothetical protein SETIT_3G262200v2 [Setaria italica]|uniref:Uncharacterized protein n=1 Tax=Setaria italica TaxID=4555 RepID=A0A368QJH4_SETIT|nr:hypothetical protein SETIT_3G262200v2 [Setaria italica]